ncbi:MAG TPA: hypothetical protein VG866_02610, partial [Candidatus Paceibacterota bacterium]|nr:hypothetical protein [Candidatus Paceibacterota bacterium]
FLAKYFAQVAMALWIAIYGAFSLTAKVDIGIRHLMPIYGFLFILTAGQAVRFYEHLGHKKLIRWLGFGLLAWYLVEFIGIYPYYLSYFNEFAGGPAGGYRYVADSNLDWGQDLWRLADYVKENHIQKISLDYFGWADQSYYIGDPFVWITGGQYVNAQQFLRDNPGGGWIAISATFYDQSLHDANQHYAWLKAYPPTTVIGHSIFVWHITQ